MDFLGGSDGKASVYNAGDPGSSPGWEDPWRRKWQSTPVVLPGKSHGQRRLVGYSLWGRKESDTTERFHFHFQTIKHRKRLKRVRMDESEIISTGVFPTLTLSNQSFSMSFYTCTSTHFHSLGNYSPGC